MGRLQGKVALVTGIGHGIGEGCARAFAREGAQVAGCDIAAEAARRAIEAARGEGLDIASLHPCDLRLETEAARYVAWAVERFGRIDILVNAAAVAPRMAAVPDLDYADGWVETLRGEADLVFLLCKAAWPHLSASGAGAIINFASVNAYRGSAVFGMAAHCAGKAAVLGLTRQLAVEGGPHNLRANSISPALIQTAATASAGALEDGPTRERLLARMLIKRLGAPQDVANCAVFLASDEAGWITGADIPVDGGVLAN